MTQTLAVGPRATSSGANHGARITVRSLTKSYVRSSGEVLAATDNIDLEVSPGEFLVLLGPSGCGKTTLLRSIAGLELPDSGRIEVDGATVFDSELGVAVPSDKRSLAMVFQSYALWPHMTALQNVAYPVRHGGSDAVVRRASQSLAEEALARVGLGAVIGQYPSQLSGGQQQRVALARAIVDNRNLILFDEPLSNVDARERERLRLLLLDMHRELGFTAIYVTHDQVEAMELADRIAVMRNGRIVQVGSPSSIYEDPVDSYVADFMGSLNSIKVRIRGVSETVEVDSPDGRLVLPLSSVTAGFEPKVGAAGSIIFRPEHVRLGTHKTGALGVWKAKVLSSHFLGAHREAILETESGQRIQARYSGSSQYDAGDTIEFSVGGDEARLLDVSDASASTVATDTDDVVD